MVFALILGAVDLSLGNRFGIGAEFERGFLTGGKLLLLMGGYICLAPILAKILAPAVSPLFRMVGADPSTFVGIMFACDAGGAPLAMKMCETPEAGRFAGLMIGAVLGPTITFTIPVSIASAPKRENSCFCVILGLIAGIVTAPLGIFAGGLMAGENVPFLLRNMSPVIAMSLLLLVALAIWKERTAPSFMVLGRICMAIAYLGVAAGAVQKLLGIIILPDLAPIDNAFPVIGEISLILAGAFPLMALLGRLLKPCVRGISRLLGINEASVLGLLFTLANSLITFSSLPDMDDKGLTINVAFAVAAAWSLGDHLGFMAQTDAAMTVPVIAAKILSGILAALVAGLLYQRTLGFRESRR